MRDIEREAWSIAGSGVNRRRFLQLGSAATIAAGFTPRLRAQSPYRVGVGRGSDPYTTTQAAIDASGEWPLVSNKVVLIKPNLVSDAVAETGAVTDPEAVRAVVDRTLVNGALLVLIVEASSVGAHFTGTGYHDTFDGYDPGNRVHLVDLGDLTNIVLAGNPNGWIYKQVHVAGLLPLPGAVFINVAKLKTHVESKVTLTAKNLFGLPDVTRYLSPRVPVGRFAMHDRGLSQTIVDLNLLRPSHFAIIEGIWGMEGDGPLTGDPVRTDIVLAGRNSVAVDRAALAVMKVGQTAVRHLEYLSLAGLGPTSLSQIDVVGDPISPLPFALPKTPPEFDPPVVIPRTLDTSEGGHVSISTRFHEPCLRKLEIVRVSDVHPHVELVRVLAPYDVQQAGVHSSSWDGLADDTSVAAPGRYAVRATAHRFLLNTTPAAATSWVDVLS